MATKLELECKLLQVEHDIKHNANNEIAFAFRATLDGYSDNERESLEQTARYYANRKIDAQKEASNLRVAIAAFA